MYSVFLYLVSNLIRPTPHAYHGEGFGRQCTYIGAIVAFFVGGIMWEQDDLIQSPFVFLSIALLLQLPILLFVHWVWSSPNRRLHHVMFAIIHYGRKRAKLESRKQVARDYRDLNIHKMFATEAGRSLARLMRQCAYVDSVLDDLKTLRRDAKKELDRQREELESFLRPSSPLEE